MEDVLLFNEYFFVRLLELHDLIRGRLITQGV